MQTQFEVFDESIVEVLAGQAGQLVRLPELGSRLTVGETGVVRLDLFLRSIILIFIGHRMFFLHQ